MISIIVIGYNEGWRLAKCMNSISAIIQKHPHLKFEVIYVDSQSNDDSVERAKTIVDLQNIYIVTGEKNAAISRNIGARESSGNILFFVDGDMELNVDFLNHAINEDGNLYYDVLTGHLDDYLYNYQDEFLGKTPRTYSKTIPNKVELLHSNGGIFIIKKAIWEKLNGMNSKFKVNEDIDLSIRLKKIGYKIFRLPYLITNHHTIDYRNEKRMWKNLKQGYGLYPGLLFREHLFNYSFILKMMRTQYTALFLPVLLVSLLINTTLFITMIGAFILIMSFRVIAHTQKGNIMENKIKYFFERFLLQLFLDISFWLGFLCYYPQSKKEEYTTVQTIN